MKAEEATQKEINKWEREHFESVKGWEKDYEAGTITFWMDEKRRDVKVFKIKLNQGNDSGS